MFRIAVISFLVCADDSESERILVTEKQTELPIISDDTIGDLFGQHPQRFVVTVAEDDFKFISNKDSKEYKALVECSSYFFDQYEKPEDRFPLLLLNSTSASMLEDAKTFLNCTEKLCYSLELDTQGEDNNENGSASKAYTRSIKDFGFPYVSENSGLQHDFLGSCKKFVDRYVSESKQNTAEYFVADMMESEEEMDEGGQPEGEFVEENEN